MGLTNKSHLSSEPNQENDQKASQKKEEKKGKIHIFQSLKVYNET